MATVIATISNAEMIERLVFAALSLRCGKKVVMQPGVLNASGWTPQQVIKFLLKEMNEQEAILDNGFGDEVIIKVWMEQRLKDGCFVLNASFR